MKVGFYGHVRQYHNIKAEIDANIQKVLESGEYVQGPMNKQFEKEFADYSGTKYSIPCGNGTDALWLVLMALGVGEGDEVITNANTFFATAEAIWIAGATAVLVDCDPKTKCIDPAKIEAAITRKTRCIMPVHLYGQCCDMPAIKKIADKYKLWVIEDNAQAIDAAGDTFKIGELSDAVATSFIIQKNLGCFGDGGAIVTNNEQVNRVTKLLRAHGVNRISLGVQSLDEPLLERLGRIHTRGQVFKAFDALRQAGFDNLNVDLMFALPGQTMDTWRATLDEALALGSEHLSSYEVIYEEDAPLFAQLRAGQFAVDEDLACAMYKEWLDRAAAAGFRPYEIANLARHRGASPDAGAPADPEIPDRACQHNVNYWRGGAFHGVGPSATSYIGGVRTKNWSNTALYCEHLEQGRRPVESSEQLSPLARAGETAAFGLRMAAGWPFAEFQRVTGFDLRDGWREDMEKLVAQGWGRHTPERFQLTRAGLRFADTAAEMFLRPN